MGLPGLAWGLNHGGAKSGTREVLARLPQGRHARREHNQYGEDLTQSNAQKAIQVKRGSRKPWAKATLEALAHGPKS